MTMYAVLADHEALLGLIGTLITAVCGLIGVVVLQGRQSRARLDRIEEQGARNGHAEIVHVEAVERAVNRLAVAVDTNYQILSALDSRFKTLEPAADQLMQENLRLTGQINRHNDTNTGTVLEALEQCRITNDAAHRALMQALNLALPEWMVRNDDPAQPHR